MVVFVVHSAAHAHGGRLVPDTPRSPPSAASRAPAAPAHAAGSHRHGERGATAATGTGLPPGLRAGRGAGCVPQGPPKTSPLSAPAPRCSPRFWGCRGAVGAAGVGDAGLASPQPGLRQPRGGRGWVRAHGWVPAGCCGSAPSRQPCGKSGCSAAAAGRHSGAPRISCRPRSEGAQPHGGGGFTHRSGRGAPQTAGVTALGSPSSTLRRVWGCPG